MNKNKLLLRTGVIGSLIVALCCFTPLLVILLAAVSLSSFTGYLDVVLLPALAFFIALTGYALYRKKSQRDAACCNTDRHDKETNE